MKNKKNKRFSYTSKGRGLADPLSICSSKNQLRVGNRTKFYHSSTIQSISLTDVTRRKKLIKHKHLKLDEDKLFMK